MKTLLPILLGALSIVFLIPVCVRAAEEKPETRQLLVRAILSEDGGQQKKLLAELGDTGSEFATTVLTAWTRDEVYIYENDKGEKVPVLLDETQDSDGKAKAIRIDDGKFVTDAQGNPLWFLSADLKGADVDMQLRGTIKKALNLLTLAAPDPDQRHSAALKLGMSQRKEYLEVLEARLGKEKDAAVLKSLHEAIDIINLKDADPAVQSSACAQLGGLGSMASRDVLKTLAEDPKASPVVASSAQAALKAIARHVAFVDFFGTVFRGFSLGSILLVVAIGLSITFGLMGVINMAHGELIAVGAYTTYVMENVFGSGLTLSPFGFTFHLPAFNLTGWGFECYFIVALPLAFLSAAVVGLILERCVIRFLYSRPLESLLATWGVSLILQQCFRLVFGANNVQVNSPRWLSGNFTIFDVIFGYNRLFVIAFALLIVIMTWTLLTKTPLGLLIRAVMQNRDMASCMGVRTHKVNMLTFAFGSGLAGLGGAFLSQIGNVGPSMGQTYIVDCFMTVVVGGVGSLIGTIYSALGIGISDQILQQVLGNPVMGKILVLSAIILFLQWRPAGLFVTKSRSLEG